MRLSQRNTYMRKAARTHRWGAAYFRHLEWDRDYRKSPLNTFINDAMEMEYYWIMDTHRILGC